MTNPDLDKYLERLVASEEAFEEDSIICDTIVSQAHAHVVTAICAVLCEQREAIPELKSFQPHPGYRQCSSCNSWLVADTTECPFCKHGTEDEADHE